jgi:hypothetical protein
MNPTIGASAVNHPPDPGERRSTGHGREAVPPGDHYTEYRFVKSPTLRLTSHCNGRPFDADPSKGTADRSGEDIRGGFEISAVATAEKDED